jgi:hypothetical protein
VLFFKRQWPVIIAFSLGVVMWARYYVPTEEALSLQDGWAAWDRVISGFAALLGLLSLIHHHWNRIKNKRRGFGFSYITLSAIVVMALAGLLRVPLPGFSGMQNSSDGLHMWMFNNMMVPMQATMFSVLAFYMASAAFRAFRARSVEATALLVTACIVMIGRVPLADLLVQWMKQSNLAFTVGQQAYAYLDFPKFTEWLLNVPNAGVYRGIFLGIILSQIAISVRIIFGIERTYMGGGD